MSYGSVSLVTPVHRTGSEGIRYKGGMYICWFCRWRRWGWGRFLQWVQSYQWRRSWEMLGDGFIRGYYAGRWKNRSIGWRRRGV